MKVKELIDYLKECNPEAEALLNSTHWESNENGTGFEISVFDSVNGIGTIGKFAIISVNSHVSRPDYVKKGEVKQLVKNTVDFI